MLCDYSAFSVCFRFRFVSQIFASEIEGKRTRKRKRKRTNWPEGKATLEECQRY